MEKHPSERTYPSAEPSRVLHRPSGLSIPALEHASDQCKAIVAFAPDTIAPSVAVFRATLWPPMCSATKEDEHAVSTVTAGPRRPNV